MLKKQKVGFKIALLPIFSILILIIIGAVAFNLFNKSNKQFASLNEKEILIANLVKELRESILTTQKLLLTAAINKEDIGALEETRKYSQSVLKQFDDLSVLAKKTNNPELQTFVEKSKYRFTIFFDIGQSIPGEFASDYDDGLDALYGTEDLAKVMDKELQHLIDYSNRSLKISTQEYYNSMQYAKMTIIILTLMGILFGILYSIKITRSILKPLEILQSGYKSFVKKLKSLDTLQKTENPAVIIDSQDEFKDLGDGFNAMAESIIQLNIERSKINLQLKESNKRFTDSIEYASLIQNSLIPDSNVLKKYFDDFFIIWKPKDIVGGDIYIFEDINEHESILMVIDCTGHGVPGALVTMLAKAVEQQITSSINDVDINPAKMLQKFNVMIKQLLKQDGKDSISNAGFDGGILYINKKEMIARFAGAELPLFILVDLKLKIIKGDRHSIGYKKSDINYQFNEHIIHIDKGSTFYLATDGFYDQLGGQKDFPYSKKRFQDLVEKIHYKNMSEQKETLLNSLDEYMNGHEQNDDITVVGIKI